MTTSNRLDKALHLIDEAHSQDPTLTDSSTPYELHYAEKATYYLNRLRRFPAAETLQLAVRAQHLRRWEVPRSTYPQTRAGYYAWRGYLGKRQAEIAEGLCREAGYTESEAGRVGQLIRKEGLGDDDPDTQTLEDVACLVFLEDQLAKFASGYDEEKVLGVLRKTWVKMSLAAHEMALGLDMEADMRWLVEKAVAG